MTFRLIFLIVMAGVISLCATRAVADSPQSGSPRTEVIFVTPPDGWVVSVWQGGTIELAEYTPPGQVGDGYVDLLGYSVVPKLAGVNDSERLLRSSERSREGCRVYRTFDHVGRDGWFESEYLCLGRKTAANPDLVEIEFAATKLGEQGAFRVWRSWRGAPADLARMLKQRVGRDLNPVVTRGGVQEINDQDLKAAFAAHETSFFGDIARSTICDLAARSVCPPLHQPLSPALAAFVPREPFVAGFIASGLHKMSDEQFRQAFGVRGPGDGSPNVVRGVLSPGDAQWKDPQEFRKVLTVVAYGQAADGGALFLIDRKAEMSPEARTLALARMIESARQLWKVGESPGITVVVAPN